MLGELNGKAEKKIHNRCETPESERATRSEGEARKVARQRREGGKKGREDGALTGGSVR